MVRTRLVVWLLAASTFAAVPRPAVAQDEPKATVAGAYTYLREKGTGDFGVTVYTIGWAAAVSRRIAGRWSGAGELGISTSRNAFDERQQLLGLLGGVRFELVRRSRLALFAQGLAGYERFWEPGLVDSGFAFQPGAGLDLRLWSQFFVRVQGDYRMSRQGGATLNDVRVLVGAGVAIGR